MAPETKPKHTPGPWTADPEPGVGFLVNPIGAVVNDTYEEYRADAALIAAAPDLAEVARVTVANGECYARRDPEDYAEDCSSLRPDDPCLFCLAQRALQKAGVL
jgi:hypothetical protein